MSTSHRSTSVVTKSRGRYSRLTRVFLMSGLGAVVLGAAFWPPEAVQRRLAVRLVFDESLSDAERQEKLAAIESAIVDPVERAHWSADAEVGEKAKPFVFARIASLLPAAVRAETTLATSPIENEGKLTGVEVTFADSDGLRAERFAHAIVRTLEQPATGTAADPIEGVAPEASTEAGSDEALASIRREQERLQKSLEEHFRELRTLQSDLSDDGAESKKDASKSAATSGGQASEAAPSSDSPLSVSTRTNVLWQVRPSISESDLALRIEALDADIAEKKEARAELLGKFTAHHPVAAALGVAIERLERERRELEELLRSSNDSVPTPPAPSSSPRPAPPQAAIPRPQVPAPTHSRPAVAPAPVAPIAQAPSVPATPAPAAATPKRDVPPPVAVAPKPAPAPAPPTAEAVRKDDAADGAAAAKIAAEKRAVAAALERAIRSEEALQQDLRSLAEASKSLAIRPVANAAGAPSERPGDASVPPALHAEIVDIAESETVENRFALLVAGATLFACLMTVLTWIVTRERAVVSADEVRRASGLPVVGQSTGGLLDRKPARSLASVAVSGSLKVVEGAAFATAVFCVAALAAENPRCEQILRQPLAIAWQALQSLT